MSEPNVSIEMYTDARGEYRWRMTNDGDIIAMSSEGYENKSDCRHAAHLFRMAGHRFNGGSLEYVRSDATEVYWRFDASNGETIAVSPDSFAYDEPEGRDAFFRNLSRAMNGGFYVGRITDATDE